MDIARNYADQNLVKPLMAMHFFVRDLRLIPKLTDDQLIRLAIIAGGIVASYDLTLFCLGHLVERGLISTQQVDGYFATLPGSAVRG